MKRNAKLNDNGLGSLRANLPKVFTDHLEWTKDTKIEVELKGTKLIIKKVGDVI